MSEQRYARLQGLRVGVSVKQGDYVYVPDNIILVKKIENIGDEFEDLLQYLYDNRFTLEAGRIYLWDEYGDNTHMIIIDTDRRRAQVINANGEIYYVSMADGPLVYDKFQHVEDVGECDDYEDFVSKSGSVEGHIIRGEVDYKPIIRVGDYFLGGNFGLGRIDGDSIEHIYDDLEMEVLNNASKIEKIVNGTTIVKKAKQDESGRVIEETYYNQIQSFEFTYGSPNNVELEFEIKSPKNHSQLVYATLSNATASLAGVMSATDKTRVDTLWKLLQDSEDDNFVDTINEILEIFENYPEGMDIVAMFATKADKTTVNAELALKSDKVETRAIGEETITYTGDKVTQIESDTVLTEIFYKPNGEIDYITEFYKGDSKTYKTTLTKVEGIITKITKEII